jgi:biopolymer transport protein ExbD
MAVKIRRLGRAAGDLNMASISDIVFLLLIFFLVTTIFQQDIGLPFVLPGPDSDQQAVKIKESNVVELQISANNVLTIDGTPLRINALKNELERRLHANPKLVVILSTHPKADYGTMVSVLDEIRLAKCRKMALKMLEV